MAELSQSAANMVRHAPNQVVPSGSVNHDLASLESDMEALHFFLCMRRCLGFGHSPLMIFINKALSR